MMLVLFATRRPHRGMNYEFLLQNKIRPKPFPVVTMCDMPDVKFRKIPRTEAEMHAKRNNSL